MSRIDRIITLLRELESLPDPTPEAGIEAWRERIDRIDRIVLELLNERSRSANAIGHVKQQLGLPIYVPEREHQVLDGMLQHNQGPLTMPPCGDCLSASSMKPVRLSAVDIRTDPLMRIP